MSPTFFMTMVKTKAPLFTTISEFKEYLLRYVTEGYEFLYYGEVAKYRSALADMERRINSLVMEFIDVISEYIGKGAKCA